MDKFTASNGLEIDSRGAGGALYIWDGEEFGGIRSNLTPDEVQALREFFRAEEDERLGRWRHPEHSQFTVKRNPNGSVYVHNETTGNSEYVAGRHSTGTYRDGFWGVARDYYDAHPERKPWHDAKPGELWRVELPEIGENSYVAGDYTFRSHDHAIPIEDSRIISARRIWPED